MGLKNKLVKNPLCYFLFSIWGLFGDPYSTHEYGVSNVFLKTCLDIVEQIPMKRYRCGNSSSIKSCQNLSGELLSIIYFHVTGSAFPSEFVLNKAGSPYLTNNCIIDDKSFEIPVVSVNKFITSKGICLGLSKNEVFNKYGNDYKLISSNSNREEQILFDRKYPTGLMASNVHGIHDYHISGCRIELFFVSNRLESLRYLYLEPP